MGIARTNGKASNQHQRLGAIAAELEPKRGPAWVAEPNGRTPAQGWWWTPQGMAAPVFLGHNSVIAETALRNLIDAHYKATA